MNRGRFDYIDTLRAVAAISIVLFHMRSITIGGPLPIPSWLQSFVVHVCGAGVPLFFVISAFLLSMLMPTYEGSARPVMAFYIKRLCRIAPLFYFVIVLWSLRWLYYGAALPSPEDILLNVTFVFNLVPHAADSLAFAGWTIGVEMLFYLIFPALYRLLPNLNAKITALIFSIPLADLVATMIAHSGMDPVVLDRYRLLTFFHHLPLFFMGMAAFDVYELLRKRSDAPQIGLVLIATSTVIFAAIIAGQTTLIGPQYWQGSACALALLAFSVLSIPGVNKATAFLGRISYSIYLLHGLIIRTMGDVFHPLYGIGLPDFVSFALACAFAMAVIIPISWLTFVLVEEPGNALGRRMVRMLGKREAPRQVAV
jgi:peptidoglycan/LPS O-acetylase OafA/YrhL